MSVKIPGIEHDFGGGRVYTLAPLTLGVLQSMQKRLENLSKESALTPEALKTVLEATYSSLKRNYPSITLDDVGELVDVANMLDVITLVLDVGGFKRKSAEDLAKNQSAQLTMPLAAPAGPDSSLASAPTPAGPGPTSETN